MLGTINTAHETATQFPGNKCKVDLTTERSSDSQAAWVIDVLGLLFDMLYMDILTTRKWQMSGRLVQQLNGCTVYYPIAVKIANSYE